MNRRDFLKTGLLGVLGTTLIGRTAEAANALVKTPSPDLAAIHGGTPEAMWSAGIKALGGMGRFVKKGDKVVVKPNIAWTQPPEHAANTNPELVAAIVRDALAAGASEVIVFDHTCDNSEMCYRISGIAQAAEAAGARVLSGADRKDYREIDLPAAKVLKKAAIFNAVLDCDVFINVPILKHHGGAKMTAAMKNLMGIVWDRGAMHKGGLTQTIPDVLTARKPDLNVIDAYRMLMDHGPRGGNLRDVTMGKFMILSPDAVAADAAAVKLLKFEENQVRYIAEAARRGLGQNDLVKLDIHRHEM